MSPHCDAQKCALAHFLNCQLLTLSQKLFEHTGGMFPELITRTDLSVFLPPIGGCTAYIFGDPASIPDASKRLTVRVHDECNGSDVFGSDICTCRPYLIHGIEECIREAQSGGAGLIVYNRKEGRALGEVTKFMCVANALALSAYVFGERACRGHTWRGACILPPMERVRSG